MAEKIWGTAGQEAILRRLGRESIRITEITDGEGYDAEADVRETSMEKAPPAAAFKTVAAPCLPDEKDEWTREKTRKKSDRRLQLWRLARLTRLLEEMDAANQKQSMATLLSNAHEATGGVYHDYGGASRHIHVGNRQFTLYARARLGIEMPCLEGTCDCHRHVTDLRGNLWHGWGCGAKRMQKLIDERHDDVKYELAGSISQLPGKQAETEQRYLHTDVIADVAVNSDELFIDVAIAAPQGKGYIAKNKADRVAGAAAEARYKEKEVKYYNALNPPGSQGALRANAEDRRSPRRTGMFILEATGRFAKRTWTWLRKLFKGQMAILRELCRKISYILASKGGELLVQGVKRWGRGAQAPARRSRESRQDRRT